MGGFLSRIFITEPVEVELEVPTTQIAVRLREKPVGHYWCLQGSRKCFTMNGRYNVIELRSGETYEFENPYHDEYPLHISKSPWGGDLEVWRMESKTDRWKVPEMTVPVFYVCREADKDIAKRYMGGMIVIQKK